MNFENEKSSIYLSKVIDGLCDQYNGIYIINIENKKLHVIKYSDYIVGLKDSLITNETYAIMMKKYILNNVLPDDYEKIEFAVNLDAVLERLKYKDEFQISYCTNRDNLIEKHTMKCMKVGEKENFEEIIIAFTKAEGYSTEKSSYSTEAIVGDKIKKTVLVVEDNEINREMMKAILEDSYEIIEAENGEMGFQILSEKVKDISAVILDLYMPICTGFEFLDKVREDKLLRTVPIIVTTSSEKSDDEVKCLSLGASDFITKPYKPQVIIGRLNSMIRLHESISTLNAIEYDFKTGMYTREAFMHYADDIISNAGKQPLFLVACEIENLAFYGATFGDRIRDDILSYLAKKFKQVFQKAISYRNSNIFFWIFSKNYNIGVLNWKEIIADIVDNAPVEGLILRFALYPNFDKNVPVSSLCTRMNQALDKIRNSPNYFTVYDEKFVEKLLLQQNMETSFDSALENGEFVPFFQPKYDSKTNKIIGAEALVRWIKDGEYKYFPNEFIPIFEKDGLVVRLDEYIFTYIVKFQKERLSKGLPVIPISVNLSRTTLFYYGTIKKYEQIIKKYDIPFDLVPLEITESATYGNSQIHNLTMKMTEIGFKLHIDDFGSGMSSLSSLNTLPFHTLKIDKSIIDYIGEQKGNILVSTIITMSHQIGLGVIAEGVETKEQVEFLKKMDCDAIQGYYFSKPIAREEFEKLI